MYMYMNMYTQYHMYSVQPFVQLMYMYIFTCTFPHCISLCSQYKSPTEGHRCDDVIFSFSAVCVLRGVTCLEAMERAL